MQNIISAVVAPEFIRSVVLLLVTAAIAGFLVPQIAASLADRRQRRQKLFEAELTRQRDIMAAQSDLLRSLSRVAWRFQLLNINVSFCELQSDASAYEKACERYHQDSADLLGQIRAEISTAKRLVSPKAYKHLRALYFDTLLQIDSSLEQLIRKGKKASREDWMAQHSRSFDAAQADIERVLTELSVEFKLTAADADATGA